MKVDEFIKKYNYAKDKKNFLSDNITKKHISYVEKIADCERVINATSQINGMFKLNTPIRAAFFAVNMISKFYDIEIEDNLIEVYEKLDELNLVNELISIIPERERETYYTILNMCNDDYMENNRNIVSYFETKIQALGLSLDALLDGLSKIIQQEQEDIEQSDNE